MLRKLALLLASGVLAFGCTSTTQNSAPTAHGGGPPVQGAPHNSVGGEPIGSHGTNITSQGNAPKKSQPNAQADETKTPAK